MWLSNFTIVNKWNLNRVYSISAVITGRLLSYVLVVYHRRRDLGNLAMKFGFIERNSVGIHDTITWIDIFFVMMEVQEHDS